MYIADSNQSFQRIANTPAEFIVGRKMELQIMEWVSIISAVAACFAVWYAARSNRIAKQAYGLALEQDRRYHPSLELYLVDSYIERMGETDERLFVFRLMISNKSASRNSIKDIHLWIEYQRGEGPPSNVSIPHNSSLINRLKEKENPLKLPLIIDSYSVVGGSAVFNLPNEMFRGSSVETYKVTIIDNSGQATELETILLQEKDNDKMEKRGNPDKK